MAEIYFDVWDFSMTNGISEKNWRGMILGFPIVRGYQATSSAFVCFMFCPGGGSTVHNVLSLWRRAVAEFKTNFRFGGNVS